MNDNYPHSYLHNLGNKKYALSVIIDKTIRYTIYDELSKPNNGIHWIAFDQKEPAPSDRVESVYEFFMEDKEEVYVTTCPILAPEQSRTVEQNLCRIHEDDTPNTPLPPGDHSYLPHLYLTRQNSAQTECQLFIAIPASGFTFKIENGRTSGDRHTIAVKELAGQPFTNAIWKDKTKVFTIPMSVEFVTVEVFDTVNSLLPRAKGTIRHSAADNKPFDLLKCEQL
jgi:hypothetical protein